MRRSELDQTTDSLHEARCRPIGQSATTGVNGYTREERRRIRSGNVAKATRTQGIQSDCDPDGGYAPWLRRSISATWTRQFGLAWRADGHVIDLNDCGFTSDLREDLVKTLKVADRSALRFLPGPARIAVEVKMIATKGELRELARQACYGDFDLRTFSIRAFRR